MSGQKKSYCNVADYISVKYPDFHQALVDTCAISALGGSVTVVVPTDEVLKVVNTKINNGSPEHIKDARDHLLAHVFDGALKTGDDFKSNPVNNRMPVSQNVGASKLSDKKVTLKTGSSDVVIDLDTGFLDATRRGAAVWKANGAIAPTTDKPAIRNRVKPGTKTGGYAVADIGTQSERFKIGIAVENEVILQIGSKRPAEGFCNAVYSLAKHVYEQDRATYFSRVLPNITHTPGDFYILVEPHNRSNQYLIDDGMIAGWWKNRPQGSRSFVDSTLEEAAKELSDAAIYSKRQEVIGAVTALRTGLAGELSSAGNSGANKVIDAYKKFAETNSIGSITGVLPADLAAIYKRNPVRRIIEDDARYYLDCAVETIYRGMSGRKPSEYLHDLDGVFNVLGDNLSTLDDPIVCSKLIVSSIRPVDQLNEVGTFVRSSFFMGIPLAPEDTEHLSNCQSFFKCPPHDEMFLNAAQREVVRHQRLAGAGAGTEKIIALIETAGVKLTAEQKKQILARA